MIKKLLASIVITFGLMTSLMVMSPQFVGAADLLADPCNNTAAKDSAACTGRSVNNPVADVIARVIQIIFMVTGFASVIVIIVSGFRYIISSGDPNNVNGAKNGILFAVIGLAVSVVGASIVGYVLSKL
jgi:hypothetical protein